MNNFVSQVALRNTGKMVYIPGLPPMYDYELMPQSVSALQCIDIFDADDLSYLVGTYGRSSSRPYVA